ncbi:MAG: hypothetical protein Q7L07_18565 [Pseudohongiella sp.]|nr:hypothetical protein [Pseudohongiella sp.]MDP2285739.1 hypothetical protein [Pseudohongiella sp.]
MLITTSKITEFPPAEFLHLAENLDRFMHRIDEAYDPAKLSKVQEVIAMKNLPKGSFELLRQAWITGEFKRGQAAAMTG